MLVRALIVLFVILNAGAATWWIAHDSPAVQASAPSPAGVARLQLVSERAAVAPPPSSAATSAPAEAPAGGDPATPPAQHCYSFGPFPTRDAGASASARLKPLVKSFALREQAPGNTSARGWRVYLPAHASLEQAQAAADRIAAAGFSDFFVVREGAEANSIALGRYSSEQAARKRAETLAAAGFPAQAEALAASGGAFWVDVVADAAFDARRAQGLLSAAQHRAIDCPAAR